MWRPPPHDIREIIDSTPTACLPNDIVVLLSVLNPAPVEAWEEQHCQNHITLNMISLKAPSAATKVPHDRAISKLTQVNYKTIPLSFFFQTDHHSACCDGI